MIRRQHNSARVIGGLLIVIGLAVMFISGRGGVILKSAERATANDTMTGEGNRAVLVQGEDGEARILVPQARSGGRPRSATGNIAARDRNFRGTGDEVERESLMEFLGLYDSDLVLAAEILLIVAGGFLIIASYMKR